MLIQKYIYQHTFKQWKYESHGIPRGIIYETLTNVTSQTLIDTMSQFKSYLLFCLNYLEPVYILYCTSSNIATLYMPHLKFHPLSYIFEYVPVPQLGKMVYRL
jgi:hypothetical protein